MRNFKSHSETLRIADTNDDIEVVDKWAEDNELLLIHNPKLLYFFNSGKWKMGYNSDIILMSCINDLIFLSNNKPLKTHTL